MKILVFEYITGGGFNKQALPAALAAEGQLMLKALLDNLSRLNHVDVTVMLDWRQSEIFVKSDINAVIIRAKHDVNEEFARLVEQVDLVWPIAPEFDGILLALCQTVESLGKQLLTSPASAVAVAGNKFKTYELLNRSHIDSVPTRMLTPFDQFGHYPELDNGWIIKPVDGAGCTDSYVVANQQDFERMLAGKGPYVMQPHLEGKKTSLSCLFKQGCAWLVCVNLQNFELSNRQYHLIDIEVNQQLDFGRYQYLIDQIALVMPDLWGYVGIDLIETATQTWVLEINPRLTTSFSGIYEALGINIAGAVLQLVQGEPLLNPTCNKVIKIQTDAN